MARRVRIGDVVEISTRKGLVYAQCSHQKPKWGHLLRILPGFHRSRPGDFTAIVSQEESYFVFFPLQAAVNRGVVSVVGNELVPERAQPFPLLRLPGMVDRDGTVLDWWLWDGEKQWRIGPLPPEQRRLSIQSVINDTALVERLEEGWTPSTDPMTLRSR